MGKIPKTSNRYDCGGSGPGDTHEPLVVGPSRYVLTTPHLDLDVAHWAELRPGVRIRELFMGADLRIALLSYIPGASVPMHLHTGDEHIFVIEGSQSDEHGEYPAGSYVFNPAGSRHSVNSRDGCLVLIQWRGPVKIVDDNNE
ncbi:MAG: cupin domain-containing protein [Acidiferrobacter sp.]